MTELANIIDTERFTIVRQLGAGGFGVVYQAYDRERNCEVALKTLHKLDPAALYNFKMEFRALADVTHPNLVALYELISDNEKLFFTMELVEGVNFCEYVWTLESSLPDCNPTDVRTLIQTPLHETKFTGENISATFAFNSQSREDVHNSPTLPVSSDPAKARKTPANKGQISSGERAAPIVNRRNPDIARLRSALTQLVYGLNALHKTGKLHRDIKPSNVLVSKTGRVVILDFGLVTELPRRNLNSTSTPVGTPAYMSPEQVDGLGNTPSTDWYSVGCMLYEVLVGRPPFGGNIFNVMMTKQSTDAIPPQQLVRGLPEDLCALCMDLLNRRPEKRPCAQEIIDRLGSDKGRWTIGTVTSSLIDTSLIGREHHLEMLRDAYRRMQAGTPVTVYLQGSSGMGKSALVRYFLDDLERSERDVVVLFGRCYEQESVPYKALDSLIDGLSQYLKRLPDEEVQRLLPAHMAALSRLFPVFKQVALIEQALPEKEERLDGQELRRQAFAALREMLARLAERVPLVLFIDDLQWGDPDSAALLSELLYAPSPPNFLMIASYRGTEADTSILLRTLLPLKASPPAEVVMLEVKELTLEEAQRLAMALSAGLSGESAATIARESKGNPFFVGELVRFANGGEQQRDRSAIMSLDEMIRYRVARLPAEARRLLELVAVAGQPVNLTVMRTASQLAGDEQASITLLRAENLLRERGLADHIELETYHDRIREAVAAGLAPDQLKAHHSALARAYEGFPHADAETLAVHLHGAGEDERAARYAVVAARSAEQALAFDRAARLYDMALSLASPTASERQAYLIKMGEALVNAGRGADAGRSFRTAALQASHSDRIELQRRAAEQFLRSGHIDEGFQVLRAVLASLGMKFPDTRLQSILSLIKSRLTLRLRGLKYREQPESEIAREVLQGIDTCWSVAAGLGVVDNIRGFDFHTRHLLLALRAGEPYRLARGITFETGFYATGGRHSRKRTEQLLAISRALVERHADPFLRGLLALVEGSVSFFNGEWWRAYELETESEQILREQCTGVTWELDTIHIYLLRSLFYLGRFNELMRRSPALLKEAQERSNLYAETYLRLRISAMELLARDRAAEARAELDSAIARWSQRGFHFQHYFHLHGQVEAALYAGDCRRASALIDEYWPAIKGSLIQRIQIFLIESLYLRARAGLAGALETGNSKMLKSVERDAALIERERMPWGNALALLIRGAVAAARRDARADEMLFLAQQQFQSLDMSLHRSVTELCRGHLVGGDQGQRLITIASERMQRENIVNPTRLAFMFIPCKSLHL